MVLESGAVRLRPISARDRRAWREVRQRNQVWLHRWDATAPPGTNARPRTFGSMVRAMLRSARAGKQLPFVIEYDGRFVGQVTVNNVIRGSAQFASVGYWIDERVAGRGIMPRALALTIDHCFGPVGLHRIEVAIRPENHASLRVVDKLEIPLVGLAAGYLHIDGDWRDHLLFGITREEAFPGLLHRLDSHQSQE
ncbi:GNAT family N-acetyltransferase [Nocardioides terrisoli]|uniref:GNAT family N-acetyltransferase n=1 Tax=Nocardioides terrisoli TaxID=3388267 RepID=UPI00287BAA23|nr:GNAT family protein [Nocardioides marmorisolisilvae]